MKIENIRASMALNKKRFQVEVGKGIWVNILGISERKTERIFLFKKVGYYEMNIAFPVYPLRIYEGSNWNVREMK